MNKPKLSVSTIIAICIVSIALLVGASGLAVSTLRSSHQDDQISSHQDDQSPSRTTSNKPSDTKSVCGLKAVEMEGGVQGNLSFYPQDWTYMGRISVPRTKDLGPGLIDPHTGVASCYARTPMGAVIAGVWITTMNLAPNVDSIAMLETVMTEGPFRDQIIAQLVDDGGNRDLPETPEMAVCGFKLLSYTGTTAWVDICLEWNSFQDMSVATYLVWDQGDWRIDTSKEDEMISVNKIQSRTGYFTIGIENH